MVGREGHPLAKVRSLKALSEADWATTAIDHNAEQDLAQKEKILRIKKPLWEQQLIAYTEYQQAESDYELAKTQIGIAQKYLETVATGLKAESVGITQAQLSGLKNRLDILRRKGLSFVLKAPFSGWVVPVVAPPEEHHAILWLALPLVALGLPVEIGRAHV